MIYAVIDTNVLVASLLTKHTDSATFKVVDAILRQHIIPLYNEEIISEYEDVLLRKKFSFSPDLVHDYIGAVMRHGEYAARITSSEYFPDAKDIVFYEVALSRDDAYLVTGNTKHFPKKPIVVTPTEMMEILERSR